jgi:hypothetical protein
MMEEVTLQPLEAEPLMVNVVTPLEVVSRNKGTLRGSMMTVALVQGDDMFASKGEVIVKAPVTKVAKLSLEVVPNASKSSSTSATHSQCVPVSPDPQFHIETRGNNESFNVELLPTRHFYRQVFHASPHVNVFCAARNNPQAGKRVQRTKHGLFSFLYLLLQLLQLIQVVYLW